MPFVEVNAVPHYYEFVGPHPQEQNSTGFPLPVVMTAGGQKPGEAMRDLANMLLEHGVEAGGDQANGVSFILWDRRNSEGRTGVKFDDELSIRHDELEVQCTDLYVLLTKLKLLPCVLLGNSSGARLSLLFAHLFPDAVRGLVLINLTAGPIAAEVLSRTYYGQHVTDIHRRGMFGIFESRMYATMCAANEATAAALRATQEGVLLNYLERNFQRLREQADPEAYPVLGIPRSKVEDVQHAALVLHNFGEGECDSMHSLAVSTRVSKLLRNAALVHSTDPVGWFPALTNFVERLRVAKRMDDEERGIVSPRLTLDEDEMGDEM